MIPSDQFSFKTKSRLDPEIISRRDFLGLSALASAFATFLFAFIGMLRLPKATVLASPSKKFTVTLPENLPLGQPFIPEGRNIALIKAETGFYAISTVCTHLGCIVKSSATGFDCPCHGSKFNPDGSVLRGPAPKPLSWLKVSYTNGTKFTVDEGTTVPAGTIS